VLGGCFFFLSSRIYEVLKTSVLSWFRSPLAARGESEPFLGGAVWLRAVWRETRLPSVNSGDGGGGKGAASFLGRDGAKKIHPGWMLVGRETARHGEGKVGIWDGAFWRSPGGVWLEIGFLLLSSRELLVTEASVLPPGSTEAGDKRLVLDLFHSRALRPEMGKDEDLVGSLPKPSQNPAANLLICKELQKAEMKHRSGGTWMLGRLRSGSDLWVAAFPSWAAARVERPFCR